MFQKRLIEDLQSPQHSPPAELAHRTPEVAEEEVGEHKITDSTLGVSGEAMVMGRGGGGYRSRLKNTVGLRARAWAWMEVRLRREMGRREEPGIVAAGKQLLRLEFGYVASCRVVVLGGVDEEEVPELVEAGKQLLVGCWLGVVVSCTSPKHPGGGCGCSEDNAEQKPRHL